MNRDFFLLFLYFTVSHWWVAPSSSCGLNLKLLLLPCIVKLQHFQFNWCFLLLLWIAFCNNKIALAKIFFCCKNAFFVATRQTSNFCHKPPRRITLAQQPFLLLLPWWVGLRSPCHGFVGGGWSSLGSSPLLWRHKVRKVSAYFSSLNLP